MKRNTWTITAEWIGIDGISRSDSWSITCSEKVAKEAAGDAERWHAAHKHTGVKITLARK